MTARNLVAGLLTLLSSTALGQNFPRFYQEKDTTAVRSYVLGEETDFEKRYHLDLYGKFSDKEVDVLDRSIKRMRDSAPWVDRFFAVLAKYDVHAATDGDAAGVAFKNYDPFQTNDVSFYDQRLAGNRVILIDDLDRYANPESAYRELLAHELGHLLLTGPEADTLRQTFRELNKKITKENEEEGLTGYADPLASGYATYKMISDSLRSRKRRKTAVIEGEIKTIAAEADSLRREYERSGDLTMRQRIYKLLGANDKRRILAEALDRSRKTYAGTAFEEDIINHDIVYTIEYFLSGHWTDDDPVLRKKIEAVDKFIYRQLHPELKINLN